MVLSADARRERNRAKAPELAQRVPEKVHNCVHAPFAPLRSAVIRIAITAQAFERLRHFVSTSWGKVIVAIGGFGVFIGVIGFTITVKSRWPTDHPDKTFSQTEQFLGVKDAGGHVVVERGT